MQPKLLIFGKHENAGFEVIVKIYHPKNLMWETILWI